MIFHASRALIWGWGVALTALTTGFWVDRRFNRSHYDAEQAMDFADSLHRVRSGEVIGDWVDVVEGTMQPAAVGVWVRG